MFDFGFGFHYVLESISKKICRILIFGGSMLYFQYADLNRHVDALNAWRNATVLKPEHSLAWNNMIILLDNTGTERGIK